MITYYVVMGVCLLLASSIERQTWGYGSALQGMKYHGVVKLQYYLIIVLLIWFAGLRTGFNDTWTYAQNYNILLQAGPINWSSFSLSGYGIFSIYQQILKTYVSSDAQVLIFTSAIITNCMYMHYIAKHSENMAGAFYLFLLGLFPFSMGGMKQAIAIAFGLYAIDGLIERKYIKALLMFAIGFGFHPYMICLCAVFMLQDRVWKIKTMIVAMVCILIMANLESVLGVISEIGKEYSVDAFTDSTINPARVVVQAIPVIISFFIRERINEENNPILTLGTNMNIIGFLFIALGLFFNPMYMGRISTYFTAMSMVSVPMMLEVVYGKNNRQLITMYYVFMGIYYLLDLTKLGTYSLFQDQFYRISIGQFLQRLAQ